MSHQWLLLLLSTSTFATVRAMVDPTRENCTVVTSPTRVDTTERVAKLREKMLSKNLDAYIIPTSDEHQNEYVSAQDKRRAYITGFSGSAGIAVVTANGQALWTDGRYYLQASDELDCNWWLMRQGESATPTITQWLKSNLDAGNKVGANAKLLSTRSWLSYKEALQSARIEMVTTDDLVGIVWEEDQSNTRPDPSNNPLLNLEINFSGRTWSDKVADIQAKLTSASVDAVLVSALDEVAWLFNLRGSDISFNPVFFAYAIVENGVNPKLFLRAKDTRLIPAIREHLKTGDTGDCQPGGTLCVQVEDYNMIDNDLRGLSSQNKTVWLSDSTNYYAHSLIEDKDLIYNQPSPLLLIKAIKNTVERQGMRNSHIRDSAAIIEFITRLEEEIEQATAAWDELKVCEELEKVRRKQKYNQGLSFGTIAGSDKNGAYIHYSPSVATNRPVDKTSMLLLDSGGQYLDGTTDITRTFHFGTPTSFQKVAYTDVLLGAIDLARAIWPANITLGSSLDSLARRPLWSHGLNYGHGTGHGIGMFLNVHEGPASIGPAKIYDAFSTDYPGEQPIYDGMFFSDEPGYYDEEKEFGVRLETIVMASYVETEHGAPNEYLRFEAIALVPFEPKLINLEMLSREQRIWLNNYHAECLEKTGAFLKENGKEKEYKWLAARTQAVSLDDSLVNSASNNSSLIWTTLLILLLAFIISK